MKKLWIPTSTSKCNSPFEHNKQLSQERRNRQPLEHHTFSKGLINPVKGTYFRSKTWRYFGVKYYSRRLTFLHPLRSQVLRGVKKTCLLSLSTMRIQCANGCYKDRLTSREARGLTLKIVMADQGFDISICLKDYEGFGILARSLFYSVLNSHLRVSKF